MNADNPNHRDQLPYSSHTPLVYMMDGDKEHAENLLSQATAANYRVHVVCSIDALQREVELQMPDAIVVDMAFEGRCIAGAEFTGHCAHALHIPVIFLGTKSDVEARLAAVRAGAAHYFVKPVKPEQVIARLDYLTCKSLDNPYRIMLVDDDPDHLALFTRCLEDDGMRVIALGNPWDALDRISRCLPELIALDVDMPGLTGLELAAIIRQMEEYNHIPIVFLGSNSAVRTRLTGWHPGAGDFLDKFIPVEWLARELKMRVVEARSQQEGRLRMQRAMKDLGFMLNALDEHAIVTVTDLNGCIAYANSKFAEISGYSMQEVLGKTHRIVKSGGHPSSLYEEMWSTISSGKVWHGTLTNRAKNGSLYDVYTTIIPELNSDGLPKRYLSIRTDVTAIRSLEQQKQSLQEQLLNAAKMESIGHLTSGIAHDFNNLLGGMLGYAELGGEVLSRINGTDKLKHYLAQIAAAGNRAKELINQMLIFSRVHPDSEEVPVTLLQPVLKEVINLLRSSITSTIELNYHVEDKDLRARIHPVQLHQILMNLAINARDAIGEYGRIDVRLSRRSISGTCDSCHGNFGGDDYVQLCLKDTGEGIAEHLRTKIFDPFFTTKEVGKGTGMGLSVVHGIVHKLGGHISLEVSDSGTIFRILLPAVTSDAKAESHNHKFMTDAGVLCGLRIMVVDDERAISSMLQELLSIHGAEVAVYNHPLKALEAFMCNPQDIDRVITDEAMLDISGLDMAKTMLDTKPDLPILLCTGYSEHVNEKIARQEGIAGFMRKPLEIAKLLQWLHKPAQSEEMKRSVS